MNPEIKEYLATFDHYLAPLPEGERETTYRYYEELFLDSGMGIDQIYQEFGQPKNLARQVNANYAMGWTEMDADDTVVAEGVLPHRQTTKQRNPWNAAWLILLGVFASPILIPVALFLVFIFALVILGLIFGIFITAGLMIGAVFLSVVAIVFGVGVMTQNIMMSLMLIGGGVALLGGIVLIVPIVVWIVYGIGWIGYRIARWIGNLTLKRRPELAKEDRQNEQ
ncbi:DUF1700 domain-containing protein [Weissella kandleri]|uniref:DUF1700 domain-containing protein n=1 Tax=Weissella kandleri TaxID=1616 RepID=UPI00387EE6C7